jgi:general secretion pathway protein D
MVITPVLLSAFVTAQQIVTPSEPFKPRQNDVWVAQAEAEEDEASKAPRVRPPVRPGARRFLGRDGLKNSVRRQPLATPKAAAAPDAPAASAASPPPGSAPRPAPTPAPSAAPSGTSGTAPADSKGAADIDFAARARKGKFSFEFSKAEIVDVVKAISNLMRRNFIIPEKLKSQRITILSPTKITAAEAYRVFLAALEVNGITVVRAGKFYKLVEAKDAIKAPIPTCVGPGDECPRYSDLMVTVLIHLKHVDATQINPVLKSLTSKEGELTVFQPSNALIISEYAPNLTRLRRIIESLDVPGFEDELQIVQITYATASEIADKVTQIFEVQARGGTRGSVRGATAPKRPTSARKGKSATESASPEGSADVSISKIVPDDRTNQIIIKANRRSFDAIRKLIDKLDVPVGEEEGNVHVVYLENASAEDLSSTLSSLAQGSSSTKHRPTAARGTAAAKQAAGSSSAVLFEGEVKITADKATNSLIIVASPHDFRAIKRLIEMLDTARRQVYVEAAIIEVTVTDNNELGVSWHAPMRFSESDLGSELGGGDSFGFVQSAQSDGGISPTVTALTDPTALLSVAGGSLVGIVGKGRPITVGDTEVSLPAFGILLKALESSSNAQILSTPHILTTDNEEASIEVGTKIPFRRGTAIPSLSTGLGSLTGTAGSTLSQSLSGYGSLFSSTDRIDVSLKLTLTPQINERDKIRLEIDQQIEDLVGTDELTQQPITANRAAKTVVVVDDQQTVVIGGLMRDRTNDSEGKIPLLGDLPLVGVFFRQRERKVEKVNLLLVLTPYIIRDALDFQRIFERKMAEHEEFAAEYYGHRSDYRAYIDYRRKVGPLARIVATIRREKTRYENGGSGDGSELLIEPRSAPADEPDDAISVPPELGSGGDDSGDEGGGDEGGGDDDGEPMPEPPADEQD